MEKYTPSPSQARNPAGRRSRSLVVLSVLLVLFFTTSLHADFPSNVARSDRVFDRVQQCAIDNLHADLSFLDTAKPITTDEFINRHDRLAQALAASGVDAFVLEPGYTFQYGGFILLTTWT